MSWLFRSTAQAARDALRELTAQVLTAPDDIAQAARDIASLSDVEVRREISSWIEDAQAIPEWRSVLRFHGF